MRTGKGCNFSATAYNFLNLTENISNSMLIFRFPLIFSVDIGKWKANNVMMENGRQKWSQMKIRTGNVFFLT